jgi:hypothetical protein
VTVRHRAWLKLEATSTGSGRQRQQGNGSAGHEGICEAAARNEHEPRASHVGERPARRILPQPQKTMVIVPDEECQSSKLS